METMFGRGISRKKTLFESQVDLSQTSYIKSVQYADQYIVINFYPLITYYLT